MTATPWRMHLEIPADTRYLHVVRLTSAGAAAEAGLDAAEIEDIKIAVDELCSLAVAAVPDEARLSVAFVGTTTGLTVEATVPDGHRPEIDELGQAILDATVDSVEFDTEALGGGFRVTKSRSGN